MSKPAILAVDDDPQVLRAVTRDLRRQYARDYRVVSAPSGEEALQTVRELRERGDDIALFVVDQRMPAMSGVDFLKAAREIYPDARRVLLTAYADTEAAIDAINAVRLHHYLLKPWEPPAENLYPVVTDELADWRANHPPEYGGLRVIGYRWNADSHRVKDFLARNSFPYKWMDVESEVEACRLYLGEGKPALPIVILADEAGTRLDNPSNDELAERLNLQTHAKGEFYDFVIVGAGPAGLAAAVYAASEGLKTVVIEREAPGGQAGTSSKIENYLGFPEGVSGKDLARRALTQAQRFGVEFVTGEVEKLEVDNQYRRAILASGEVISCHALLIATGVSYRKLEVPGLEELSGRGVYYGAAITEALNCQGDEIYIVGGANSAGQAAVYLSEFAKKVHILVRGADLKASMSQYLIDEIEKRANITVQPQTQVRQAHGTDSLESLTLLNAASGECEQVPARALFVFIGAAPRTDWLDGTVMRDAHGFVMAGRDLTGGDERPAGWSANRDPFLLETSVPGVFVAGDVRQGSVKRVATSVGEGAIAVSFAHQHLANVR